MIFLAPQHRSEYKMDNPSGNTLSDMLANFIDKWLSWVLWAILAILVAAVAQTVLNFAGLLMTKP